MCGLLLVFSGKTPMNVYILSFNTSENPKVMKEIADMVGRPDGAIVHTSIEIYSRNRSQVSDYDNMICFSFSAPRTYKLHNLPVYVDDKYTSVYYAKDDLYAIFESDLTQNLWNIVRLLMPAPDEILNCKKKYLTSRPASVTFVNTKTKSSVFDKQDV